MDIISFCLGVIILSFVITACFAAVMFGIGLCICSIIGCVKMIRDYYHKGEL